MVSGQSLSDSAGTATDGLPSVRVPSVRLELAHALSRLSDVLTARECEASPIAVDFEVFKALLSGLLGVDHGSKATGRLPELALPPSVLAQLAPREQSLLAAERDEFRSLAECSPTNRAPVDIGAWHEHLLEFRLARLPAGGVRLKSSGRWLGLSDLLAVKPSERSVYLRRKLGVTPNQTRQLQASLADCSTAQRAREVLQPLIAEEKPIGSWVVQPSLARRRAGAHFTPPALANEVAGRCLGPLTKALSAEQILGLRICDPAMGAGVFLEAAAQYLADALVERGRFPDRGAALPSVLGNCIHGSDLDPRAVLIAQVALLTLGQLPPDSAAADGVCTHLLEADALSSPALEGTFDAVVGNPPWVAYVGRAAQPLERTRAEDYAKRFEAFRGYKTLHGLFVERGAQLLKPGGRLGLVLPTSMADLEGYAPTRAAHDALATPDPELPDYGDGAFDGVFQPCMALLSTRRTESKTLTTGIPWVLARNDLSEHGHELLVRLSRVEKVPDALFGERGYQTRPEDRQQLLPFEGHLTESEQVIRTGTEVGEFQTRPPRLKVDEQKLQSRLREPSQWQAVAIYVRQTARYPIASLADGAAFRNSIIAGFESPTHSRFQLLAWLNSSVIRWLHFVSHRDARQGMPQLKVSHLRALPAPPPEGTSQGTAIAAAGRRLGERNTGISSEERQELDQLVAEALALDKTDQQLVSAWARQHPPPQPRQSKSRV